MGRSTELSTEITWLVKPGVAEKRKRTRNSFQKHLIYLFGQIVGKITSNSRESTCFRIKIRWMYEINWGFGLKGYLIRSNEGQEKMMLAIIWIF